MLNRSASLAMSTSVLKALPGKLDIKRHSPSILYIFSIGKLTKTQTTDVSMLGFLLCGRRVNESRQVIV